MVMDVVYWVLFAIVSLLFLIYLIKYLTRGITYFSAMDFSQVISREIKIPVGDIEIHACLYLPKYALDNDIQPNHRLPLIIFNPGWGQEIDLTMLKQYVVPIVLGGPYAVLTYDFRGQGKTPGDRLLTPKILEDIPKIIDFGLTLPEIDPKRVGFIGFSFGAVVALTQAYPDERIKAVVSIVGLNNCKENFERKPKRLLEKIMLKFLHAQGVKTKLLSEEENRLMSPAFIMKPDRPDLNQRVFIMNAKHDECIDFPAFEKNQKILNLPKSQTLVLEKGGHACFHQELIVLSRVLQFFHSKL